MVMPDKWIREEAHKGMIRPFFEGNIRPHTMSYGLSSYGYDFTLAEEFRIFKGTEPLDPKDTRPSDFEDYSGTECTIAPHGFILGRTIEVFSIPRDILAICFGKSSYARSGIVLHIPPLEPEWRGHITLMIANLAPVPAIVYSGEGIGQAIFLSTDSPCEISYADKKGKYQDSSGIVHTK
ncbi:MAG: dCTP deaminase [Candidatus Ratteibacteria bacterium]|jgi:dCTP deaminase